MKRRVIKSSLLLTICLLFMTGCRKNVLPEDTGALSEDNVSENVVSENTGASNESAISNSEIAETEDTTDIGEKDMTIISILGETEIAIENSRIHDKLDGVDHLNNLFTLDEINTILNTVKGTWEADEYVGFVSYDMCGRGRWLEDVDAYDRYEGDSGWEQYQEAQAHASNNIPDFTISIKEYYSSYEGIEETENNYIYVRTDEGIRYSSPMSIVLSLRLEDDDYPAFINRTMAGIGSNENYPVIYIEFFSICDTGIENSIFYNDSIVYEPATLVLTSDGQFLLLKDGAFYSLKRSIQSEILGGDFSHLDNDNWNELESSYSQLKEDGNFAWTYSDLNGDGVEDLVLQDRIISWEKPIRVIGIFACEGDWASCVFWDDNDDIDYRLDESTGELTGYSDAQGDADSTEVLEHFYYDAEWNKITD